MATRKKKATVIGAVLAVCGVLYEGEQMIEKYLDRQEAIRKETVAERKRSHRWEAFVNNKLDEGECKDSLFTKALKKKFNCN